MKYRDMYGMLLQYGDVVENLNTHDIGVITRSSIDDTPVMYVLKEFSWRDLTYHTISHTGAAACYERAFLPRHTSKLYWRLRGYRVPGIELLRHGERNRRIKDI